MKKQSIIVMDQSRKSSEREKIALQQVQEALNLKESAVAEALWATSRENYMLELLNDASLDMTSKFLLLSSVAIHAYFLQT
jgi:predicted PhzF superfamily epimerase YddE/YHI9